MILFFNHFSVLDILITFFAISLFYRFYGVSLTCVFINKIFPNKKLSSLSSAHVDSQVFFLMKKHNSLIENFAFVPK